MPIIKRLVARSLFLNLFWVFAGSQLGRLFHKDLGGIIIGLGFLVIYSFTYYLSFDREKKSIHNFLMLTLAMIGIFLTASFILPFFFINGQTDLSVIGFLLCSSTIAFIGIIAIVGRYIEVKNRLLTIVLGAIITALTAYFVTRYLPEHFDTDKLSKFVNPLAFDFCIWQVLTTFLVGRSIRSSTSLPPTRHWH